MDTYTMSNKVEDFNFPNKRYLSVINLHFFRSVNMRYKRLGDSLNDTFGKPEI
jgi:hypothetical protein